MASLFLHLYLIKRQAKTPDELVLNRGFCLAEWVGFEPTCGFHRSVRILKIWLIESIIEVGEKVALSITERRKQDILDFCYKPRSCRELQRHLGMADKGHFMRTILRPLMEEGKICLTIPEKHGHMKQNYVAVKIEG